MNRVGLIVASTDRDEEVVEVPAQEPPHVHGEVDDELLQLFNGEVVGDQRGAQVLARLLVDTGTCSRARNRTRNSRARVRLKRLVRRNRRRNRTSDL